MRRILLTIAILFLTVPVVYCQEPLLQLTIKSDKEVYQLGEEIVFSGYFKNISSEKTYIINDDNPLLWCHLVVENPNGIEFWYDAFPHCDIGPASPEDYIAILPNQSIEYFTFKAIAGTLSGDEFNWYYETTVTPVNVRYPFVSKGIYKIKFLYINLTPTRKDALKGKFTSNTITIEVAEKDNQQIEVGMSYSETEEILQKDNLEVADWRYGDGICKVHGIQMETVVVNGLAGPAPSFIPGYFEAKEKAFPNCGIEYPPQLYSDQKGMIYVCPRCEKARKNWWNGQPPIKKWINKAPYPYENEDRAFVTNSYKEKWVESSVEKHPVAVQKAKEVLKEWGRDPEKYEYKGNHYDYKISVSESPNFISVVFHPIGLTGLERHVEVRMRKKDFMILSILPGV